MSETHVRLATEADAESIADLWLEMMLVHQELAPEVWTLGPEALERYREWLPTMMQDENRRIFVAEEGTHLIGYVVVGKGDRPPVLTPPTWGRFAEICVSPSRRREGIGRRLVAAAMEWFRAENVPLIEVGYAADNLMSVPFWEGLGFRPYMIKAVMEVETR